MKNGNPILKTVWAALEREPHINLHRWPVRLDMTADNALVVEGDVESVAAKKRVLEIAGTTPEVRGAGPLYTIFTWADAGGLLVDRLISGIDWEASAEQGQLLTDVTSISSLAQAFGLSRAHTSRKLAAAESIGGLGWSGQRGRSRLWISVGFYEEYAGVQERKLLLIDRALAKAVAVIGSLPDKPAIADA